MGCMLASTVKSVVLLLPAPTRLLHHLHGYWRYPRPHRWFRSDATRLVCSAVVLSLVAACAAGTAPHFLLCDSSLPQFHSKWFVDLALESSLAAPLDSTWPARSARG